jgi:protein SCO1/2
MACHSVGEGDKLGPDLAGVVARRDHDWLVRWLKEPDKMIAEGDPIAVSMKAAYRNLPMPNLGLNDTDASALIEFLQQEDARLAKAADHKAH